MIKRRLIAVAITAVCLGLSVQAFALDEDIQFSAKGKEPIMVTLKDVLAIALQRSVNLKAMRLNIEIAQKQLEAARERNIPIWSNSFEYGKNVSSLGADSSRVNYWYLRGTDSMVFQSGLTHKLSNGMTYGLTLNEVRSRSKSMTVPEEGETPISGEYGDWSDSSSVVASLSIPIFQDWGEVNNAPVRFAEVNKERSSWNAKKNELEILQYIAMTYWNLVGIIETVTLQQKSVHLSEQLLADNMARWKSGTLSQYDIKITQMQLARDRQNLLSTEMEEFRVKDLIRAALDYRGEMKFKPADAPQTHDITSSQKLLLDKTLQHNYSMKLLESSLKQIEVELEQARNKEKSNLDLNLNYVWSGYGSKPFAGTSDYSEQEMNGYNGKITWTIPLFDVASTRNTQKALLQKRQVELQIESLKTELTVQLQSVLRALQLAKRAVDTARIGMELAKEQLNNEIERLKLGMSTSFIVARTQQEASSALQNEVLARVNYEKIFLQLLVLTNDIYSYFDLK